MALFTLVVLAQVTSRRGPIGYDKLGRHLRPQWMKVLTFVTIVALLYHAWVGMRDVLMDYVKPVGIRWRCRSSPSSGWSAAPAGRSRCSGGFENMATPSNITTRKFDVVIVGAGGSGMRASLQLALAA